jgi:Raf kinase inhibitor-like YbhB/YbcL family protein
MRAILLTVLCAAFAGCGEDKEQPAPQFQLASPAFQANQAIPKQYSCDGADQSPPIEWSKPPEKTKSFALIVDDPDAPGGLFRHWGAYDIPASARAVQAGNAPGRKAINDFGRPGYGGPCPPKGHGPHHYHFKLFALDADRLDLAAGAKVVEVEQQAERHALGRAELIGLYERR